MNYPRMILLVGDKCPPCQKIKTQLGGLDYPHLEILNILSDEGSEIVEALQIKTIPAVVIMANANATFKICIKNINHLSKLYEKVFNPYTSFNSDDIQLQD